MIPSIYLLAALPCIWFGRSVSSVLGVYKDQADFGRSLLVFNAPNPYQFVPNRFYDIFLVLGIGTSAILGSLIPLLGRRRQVEMSPATLLEAAVLSVSTMAFFLPKMRARYFFPADLLSIALAFYQPRLFFVPLAFQFTSAFSYTGHLWHRVFVRHWILALLNGGIVLFPFWDFYRTMRRSHLNAADRQ